MSKQDAKDILYQVKDLTENIIASGEVNPADVELLRKVKRAIKWINSIKK